MESIIRIFLIFYLVTSPYSIQPVDCENPARWKLCCLNNGHACDDNFQQRDDLYLKCASKYSSDFCQKYRIKYYKETDQWCCPVSGSECFERYVNGPIVNHDWNICANTTEVISKYQPCHGNCFDKDKQFLCSSGDQCVWKTDMTTPSNLCKGIALCHDRSDIIYCKNKLLDFYRDLLGQEFM